MRRKTDAKHGACAYICALDREICQVRKDGKSKTLRDCGGINPYTLTARLRPGDLAHRETDSGLDPTARSFAQGNKTWGSSRILVG